jgi:hypothetical protein
MNVDQAISDLSTLPVGDRLRVVHAIWDTLPDDVDLSPSVEQQAEIDRVAPEYGWLPIFANTSSFARTSVNTTVMPSAVPGLMVGVYVTPIGNARRWCVRTLPVVPTRLLLRIADPLTGFASIVFSNGDTDRDVPYRR